MLDNTIHITVREDLSEELHLASEEGMPKYVGAEASVTRIENGVRIRLKDYKGETIETVYEAIEDIDFDDGIMTITLPDGRTFTSDDLTGPQGPQGIQGPIGPKGDKGDTGSTGPTGPQGPKGDKGDTGATGPQGEQGEQGIQGIQGVQGIQGEKGDQGLKGDKGDKGDTGSAFYIKKTYASYEAMVADYSGTDVAIGEFVIISSTAEDPYNAQVYVKGSEAYTFVVDLSGAAGIKGDKGDKGDTGAKGDTGPQGIQGEQGIQGPQGIQGVSGADGVSPSVTVTPITNGHEVSITDATQTQTFDVMDGDVQSDGYYDDLYAGNLMSDQFDTDNAPYVYRSTPYPSKREYLDTIVGGTVAWNQLVQNGNFESDAIWNSINSTHTVSDNIFTATATDSTKSLQIYQNMANALVNGHKYIVLQQFKGVSGATGHAWRLAEWSGGITFNGDWQSYEKIISSSSSITPQINIGYNANTYSNGDTLQIRKVQCFDLTQMFGTTIADYLYSLEQTTAGSGVAKLRSWGFDIDSYHAYQSGSLESVNVSAHVMRDANDVIIGNYPLDSDLELRGIPKLDASNNLYYDGDMYEPSGSVTRKYGVITYDGSSDEAWAGDANAGWYIRLNSLKKCVDYRSSMISAKIPIGANNNVGENNVITGYNDPYNRYPNQNWVYYLRTDISSVNELKTYLASNPITVVYELATETTETADPFTAIQTVDPYGTEQYIDYGVSQGTRDIAVPVGHQTRYMADLKGKLEALPNVPSAPSSNGTYVLKATVSGGVATYSWESEA